MSIKDFLLKIKSEFKNSYYLLKERTDRKFGADFFTVLVIAGVAFAGFGLGRLSALEGKKKPILIEKNLSLSGANANTDKGKLEGNQTSLKKTQIMSSSGSGKSFVASKSGKKYYLPWCGGVSRIKEENKIWFTSESEAKKAGYTQANNCNGL